MAPKANSPPATPNPFSQPQPRPTRSAEESAQVRIQNRRRAYLERNPAYVKSNEHELSGKRASLASSRTQATSCKASFLCQTTMIHSF